MGSDPEYNGPALIDVNPSWPIMILENICDGIFDCPHSTPKLSEDGYYMVRTQDIRKGFYDTQESVKVSEESFIQRTKRAEPRHGDILLSREGTYFGDAAEVPSETKLCLGQRMVLLRPCQKQINPTFLRIWINSKNFQNYLLAFRDGTVAERLNLSTIRKLPIPVPSLDDQARIISLVTPLEEKEELNRRMNETLEGMAQALFKSWFVDFDPVIDNALEAGNPIPEEFAARAETRRKAMSSDSSFKSQVSSSRSLFPDSFQTSELGPIPTGWGVTPIVEQVHLTMGQSPSSDHYNKDGNGLPFHQGVTNYGERFPKHEQYSTGGNRYAEEGDILFSVRAPVGRINIANCRIIIGRGLSALRHNKDYQAFLVYFLKHTFQKEDSIGSGTIFNAVNKKEMERIPFIIPTDEITKEFDNISNALDEKIASNAEETEVLTNLRDTLLPKLISGELRIEDAEKMVGKADA